MKTINQQDFDKLNLQLGDYQKQQIEKAKALAKEVAHYYPCELFYKISEQDGETYFEYPYVFLKHYSSLKFTVSYNDYRKKYSIDCPSIDELSHIDNYTKQETKNGLKQPNNIGKLNTRKIQNWVNYYESLYQQVKAKSEKNSSKIEQFRKSLEGLPVQYSDKGKSGTIKRNGIVFSFTIEPTHISQKIQLHYSVNNTLADFLKLSDNQLKAE